MLPASLLFLSFVSAFAMSINGLAMKTDAMYGAADSKGYLDDAVFVEERANRGAVSIAASSFTRGVKAMKTLLSGAKAVPPTEILRKDYVKFGGEKRALKDFYSVKPKNIHTLGEDSIIWGEVGDVTILLMKPGVEGKSKSSSLIIYKTKERELPFSFYDKITYKG